MASEHDPIWKSEGGATLDRVIRDNPNGTEQEHFEAFKKAVLVADDDLIREAFEQIARDNPSSSREEHFQKFWRATCESGELANFRLRCVFRDMYGDDWMKLSPMSAVEQLSSVPGVLTECMLLSRLITARPPDAAAGMAAGA